MYHQSEKYPVVINPCVEKKFCVSMFVRDNFHVYDCSCTSTAFRTSCAFFQKKCDRASEPRVYETLFQGKDATKVGTLSLPGPWSVVNLSN